MRRGEIYWLDFDPSVGNETRKVRPAVVVSNNALNRVTAELGCGVVTVVPLTTNTDRVRPYQVLVPAGGGLPKPSKALCEQVQVADYSRFRARIGAVSAITIGQIDTALRLHLAL